MTTGDFDVVTGAFSYSGAVIASELQAAGACPDGMRGIPGKVRAVAIGEDGRGLLLTLGRR